MHALPVNLPCVKQLPVITNEAGASLHAGSTCAIGVVTVRPFNRQPAQLYFKLTPNPNNTFFFIFTCTTQYPWVLANPDLSQAMASSKQKRTHTVFCASSTHRSASTSKPRFVGEKVRLGDVATYVNGYAFKPSDYSDSGLPIVRIQNLTGNAYRTNRYEGTLPEKFAIQDGDILISWSASLGVFEWNQGPAWLNQHIFRVVFNKAMIDKRFFVHQARFLIQKSQNLAHGATMKHLTKKVFETLPFLYLGLNNQITVAEQLDALDTQINRAKRQIRFLDNLAKSRFVKMFGELDTNPKGFQLTCFDDLGTWTSGGTPSRKNPSYFTGEIDWYSAGELNSLHLGRSKERISLRAIEESSAKLVPPGSLFVGMYDTAALKMGITTKESSSNQACANLVPNGIVDLVWLYFAIDQLKPSLLAKRSGCRQKNLSLKKIKSFMVPLPDLDSQQGFSRFVAQVDKSRFVRDHEINFR